MDGLRIEGDSLGEVTADMAVCKGCLWRGELLEVDEVWWNRALVRDGASKQFDARISRPDTTRAAFTNLAQHLYRSQDSL